LEPIWVKLVEILADSEIVRIIVYDEEVKARAKRMLKEIQNV
jgi:hypothetical protein